MPAPLDSLQTILNFYLFCPVLLNPYHLIPWGFMNSHWIEEIYFAEKRNAPKTQVILVCCLSFRKEFQEELSSEVKNEFYLEIRRKGREKSKRNLSAQERLWTSPKVERAPVYIVALKYERIMVHISREEFHSTCVCRYHAHGLAIQMYGPPLSQVGLYSLTWSFLPCLLLGWLPRGRVG